MANNKRVMHDSLQATALACAACPLADTRTQVVFARGSPEAKLWLIGEAPGADEDKQGQPFVGRAGELLDKILAAVGIGQDEVFITNTVLCRPPGNRVPTNEEITACSVHRNALLDLWKPPLVVLLGATAARVFLGGNRLGDLRGQRVERYGRVYYATFHPAYLLRDPSKKALAWKEWQAIRDAFRQLAPDTEGEAARNAASLMPYLDQVIDTPQGTGRLVQVFRDASAVVLDREPRKVTRFPTAVLAQMLARRRAV